MHAVAVVCLSLYAVLQQLQDVGMPLKTSCRLVLAASGLQPASWLVNAVYLFAVCTLSVVFSSLPPFRCLLCVVS